MSSSERARSWGIALSSIWMPLSRKTILRRGASRRPANTAGSRRRQFTGGAWGINAAMSQFPDQEFTVICLSNNDDIASWKMNERIADLALGDRLAPQAPRTLARAASELPTVELKEADLRDKIGAYRMKSTRFVWRITLQDGTLQLTDQFKATCPLRPLSATSFDPEGPGFLPPPSSSSRGPGPARHGLSRPGGTIRKTRGDANSTRSRWSIRPRISSKNTPAGTRAMSSQRPIGWQFATGGFGCA